MTRANTEQMKHTPWFAKAGAACSIVPITRFVSPNIFALKGGGYGCLFSLAGIDEEGVTDLDYIAFSERLREAHFTEDSGEKPLICRWHNDTLILDVLALNEEVLGFTNIWYEPALRHAFTVTLPGGQSIRVITAPFFLGTKMEAFRPQPCSSVVEFNRPISATYRLKWTMGTFAYS
jgi:hypothetical protein